MLIPLVLGLSVVALAVAVGLARWVLKQDNGTPEMRRISDAIQEGAGAFLRRQYRTIFTLSVFLAALIFVLYAFFRSPHPGEPPATTMAFWTTLSFVFGALCSGIAGLIGMYVAVRSNIRTASAARTSLNRALQIALRGGAVSGLFVVAMSLLGVGGLYAVIQALHLVPVTRVPLVIVGYGFGASFVALFAQLGGGIYTKAADVGADLVGKVEAGIPEDDPRNPAVIADLVGDNVGDCAGRGADLFESTAAENIGAMILGVALFKYFGMAGILFPLVARALGLVASLVGIYSVSTREDGDPMQALNRGYYLTSILAALGFYLATHQLLVINEGGVVNHSPGDWLFLAGVIGIVTSILFVFITQYYTEYRYRPVREIATASQTGAATTIITGLSVAFECTALPVIVTSAAIVGAYYCGLHAFAGFDINPANAGLYGTAIATMGMLATCAYVLAMDTFGPITDNAGGIAEMSQQSEEVRVKTDRLDSVGNTTKALTKGYAIGSAALAAFLLFSAYLNEVEHLTGQPFHSVDIAKPEVFVGGLLGAMLVFLFSGLAIRAVGRAAYYVINDVRAQFKQNPLILQGKAKPNYAQCVDIVTQGALKEMIVPGLLAVSMPIVVGLIFKSLGVGAESVAAFLMVGTIGGILVATLMNNGGGAWDKAKKYIQARPVGGQKAQAQQRGGAGRDGGHMLNEQT